MKRVIALTLLVVLLGLMWETRKVGALLNESQCKEERRIGINACKPVIHGRLPSPECCERVRVSHVECVCPEITPALAALVDMNRAIRLIQGCGRRVPRHFKCGSLTTP
ncbi:hypothetical protein FRX31_032059 [Thalictrum thalictroides]|uniref:Bifunctional inhibitor/plant lipid transfer protein/seed storage helical domain-containing protein n=1 Tax=Thalictrum thalictroides TaxID=46969 RepID=A0A7J6V2J4_THATH|nr:hypothetical protein FRX31_032059 [Thalictrum thalictroides]